MLSIPDVPASGITSVFASGQGPHPYFSGAFPRVILMLSDGSYWVFNEDFNKSVLLMGGCTVRSRSVFSVPYFD